MNDTEVQGLNSYTRTADRNDKECQAQSDNNKSDIQKTTLDGMLRLAAILCICTPIFLIGGCLMSNMEPNTNSLTEPTILVNALHAAAVTIFLVSAFTLCCIAIKDIKTRTIPNSVIYPHMLCSFCFMLACYFCFSGISIDTAKSALFQMGYGLVFSALLFGVALILSYFIRKGKDAKVKQNATLINDNSEAPAGNSSQTTANVDPLIGGGDLRLVGSLSLQLGRDIIPATGLACVIGLIWTGIFHKRNFPFGPCMALPSIVLALIMLIASL